MDIYALGTITIILLLVGWWLYRRGAKMEKGKQDAKNAKNQERYADIAVNKPSKSDTADSLRNGDF